MHIYHTIASSFPQCVNEVLTEWVASVQMECTSHLQMTILVLAVLQHRHI